MRQVSKEESYNRFNALLDFCDITNLHLEPALKGKNSNIYHASNVIHTRIIDVNNKGLQSIDPCDYNNLRTYFKILNHDGYKQPHRLIKAEQFNMKLMGFVQAMRPSNLVLNRKSKLFLERKRLYNLLYDETDIKKIYELEVEIDELRKKELVTNNNFNIDDFLHYRFWFFDLDYEYHVPFTKLVEMLRELGLFPYVNAIVRTSPTKYHIYIKSEMIASTKHVKNWPLSISDAMYSRLLNPEYIKRMIELYPKKNGFDWWCISQRGNPSIDRLDIVPVPIPEEAKLVDGRYIGDNDVFESYRDSYHDIATVLGSDLNVFNETRNAQLVGYTNPKNGYVANLVYGCKESPVLTTKIARTTIFENIQKYYANYKFPFYLPTTVKKELYNSDNTSNRNILTDIYDIKPQQKQKIRQKFSNIPDSPEKYCLLHNLQNEVIWDRDITGNSNAMLMLFSRFAHLHIDLKNTKQQRIYFDTIIRPYMQSRISKDIQRDSTLESFFIRFQKACTHNSKTLRSNKNNLDTQTKYASSEVLQEKWNALLLNAFGEDHFSVKSKAHTKLRKIICDHIINYGSLSEDNGIEYFEYQIPASLLNEVHGYKDKLKFYETIGLYIVENSYTTTLRLNDNVVRSGKCKKHKLVLKEIDVSVVEQMNTKNKKAEEKVQEEPKPISSAVELEADPSENRKLTLDYVLSVINAKDELLKFPLPPFVFKEKDVAPYNGSEHSTISNLMNLVVYKDSDYYPLLEKNFQKTKELFLGECQQRLDHISDDYHTKRKKIFNNIRPLNAKELGSLADADRIFYLAAISDLVDLSKYCREALKDTSSSDFKLKYVFSEIEKQVINKPYFYFDWDFLDILRWAKRDLQAHIWQCDFICKLKEDYHNRFLTTLDEDIEPIFRHSGSLFRDYNRKINEGCSHGGYLSPSQAIEYEVSVNLSKEESVYYRPVEYLVDQIKFARYRLPYDHLERDSISKLLTCHSSIIQKPLNNLRTLA